MDAKICSSVAHIYAMLCYNKVQTAENLVTLYVLASFIISSFLES